VFELDLELADAPSRTWRRVRVPGKLALSDLHHIIQIVFDWHDIHLHLFEVGDDEFGPPRDEDQDEDEDDDATGAGDEAAVTVTEAAARGAGQFMYVYDFRTEWRVRINVAHETKLPDVPMIECIAGDGPAPSERGGSFGPTTGAVEPTLFDLDVTNAFLIAAMAESSPSTASAALFASPDEQLRGDVTLLALLLGSWEEEDGSRSAWKALPADTLEALTKAGLIATTAARASVVLTADGIRRAKVLRERVAACL
jgi:hypothetical protein